MGWKLLISASLFLIGCSNAPKIEKIEENPHNLDEVLLKEEKSEEKQTPKLKIENIPTTPQEQIIELQ